MEQRAYDSQPPRRLWRGRDVLAAIALLAVGYIAIIGVLVGVTAGLDEADERAAAALAVLTLLSTLWIGLVVFLVAWRRGIPLAALGLEVPARWRTVALTVLASYGVVAAYTIALVIVQQVSGRDLDLLREGNPLPDYATSSRFTWTVVGVAVVVVAPLAEELFFRGLLFGALRQFWGLWPALLVSGLAFSAVHLNLSVMVPYALIGIVFAWSYHRSGSLWTPIAAHAIVNGIAFTLTLAGAAR
jgi:uncharacterized protein